VSNLAYWYCPHCKEEIDPTNVTFQELHDTCGHAVEWIEGIDLDRLREICAAERDGRYMVLPDGWNVGMVNHIMGLSERVRAMRIAKDEQDSPIITWQLYNMLVKQSRAEAEAALAQEGGQDG
jgi:hypothetical protein